MFADPCNGNVYCIPLGLIMAQGHTTHQVCDLSVALLSCFGVQADTDLFGTVNNNTNSAVSCWEVYSQPLRRGQMQHAHH